MDEKKGVMGKPTLIVSSHTFVLPTKMTLNMTTSASEASYTNLTALSLDGRGSISVGTMFNWMKKYQPYVDVCPPTSDYCDTCKERNDEISHCRQVITRLIQSGHASQGETMLCFSKPIQDGSTYNVQHQPI